MNFSIGLGAKAALICGVAMAALLPGAVLAQTPASTASTDTDEAESDEIIVTGARRAIESALERKRNAETVVDSIDATDIGAFPDKSIAEALQRVPGVNVARSAYKDDVTHFAAEPSTVIIRGLQQVRSEFNGRDIFSATSGYGLNFSDVPPELLARVDTYKNQTAAMVEGGIAGTVDVRTRLPFDAKGLVVAGNIGGSYGDLRKEFGPTASALVSNRWSTPLGEFGLLANAAFSQVHTVSQGTSLLRPLIFPAGVYGANETYIPAGMTTGRTEYDRDRLGLSFAAQWESPSGAVKATAQYNSSKYQNTWNEDTVLSYWKYVDPAANTHSTQFTDPTELAPPSGGSPFVFGNDGLFQSGVISGSRGGWGYGLIDWSTGTSYIPNSTDGVAGTYSKYGFDAPIYVACLPPLNNNEPCRAGAPINTSSRYSDENRKIEDVSFKLQWDPSPRFSAVLDLQHVKATADQYDVTFNMRTFADIGLDLTGKYPQLTLLRPSGYNLMPGNEPFADTRNYANDSIMDHRLDSRGTMNTARFDMEYRFDTPWLNSITGGVRFADRQQDHRWSAYNWASISSDWGTNPVDSWFLDSGPTYNGDGSIRFQGYEPGYYETRSFGGNILGGAPLTQSNFVFINRDILRDPVETARRFSVAGQTDQGGVASSTWNPICDRPGELADSCYLPGEILNVREKTLAGFVMLRFGGNRAYIGQSTLSGNVGARFVESSVQSAGSLTYANQFTSAETTCVPLTPEQIDALPPGSIPVSAGCLAAGSSQDQAFSSGSSTPSTVKNRTFNVLPSLNLRLDLQDGLVARFAASRGLSKPDIGLLRNHVTLSRVFVPQSQIVASNPNIIYDGSGNAVGYRYNYTASAGNPRLRPVTADQFDLSLEYYAGRAGSFGAAAFYKKFHNYIQNGTFTVPITNNGVTRDVIVTGPVNGDGASIKGLEFSYTGYFDFLPGLLSGFGLQANYTFVDNSGVKNSNLILDTTGGQTSSAAIPGNIDPGVLENLSKHSYNLILLYEKGPFGGRLAYNWRSKFLSSVNDCCVGFPVWTKSQGFLDASIRLAVTPWAEINLQGSNLLNTKTRMMAQIKGVTGLNPDQAPQFIDTGYYESDRRYEVGLRFKF